MYWIRVNIRVNIAEEKISEWEDIYIESIQNETEKEKINEQSIIELGATLSSLICNVSRTSGDGGRKKIWGTNGWNFWKFEDNYKSQI